MRYICDVHNEITSNFRNIGSSLLSSLADNKPVDNVRISKALKKNYDLLLEANKMALHMENCLKVRKDIMVAAGYEEYYKKNKERLINSLIKLI